MRAHCAPIRVQGQELEQGKPGFAQPHGQVHGREGELSIFDLLFFSVLIWYCFVKPRHSHYHDMGSIGGSVPVIA